MCGIAGYYSKQGNFNKEHLVKMTDSLKHRGPDAQGFFSDNICGLGHRRLSVIDLSERANQPITSSNDRYVIVYNGEVYNYKEIAARLKSHQTNKDDFQFKTSSDTEVVLEAFATYGTDFVQQLNGMFAIAIYDKKTEELYLFRDRIGIKPLYYYWDGNMLLFGSELKAIKSVPELELKIRKESIKEFLYLGYIPAPNSIYENIHKLDSGSYLKVSKDGIEKFSYWSLKNKITSNVLKNREQALVKLSDLIISSVQYQLESDVPFGVFLSGGIDSSLITAQAVGLSSVKVKTFSIGLEENSHNESEYAKTVANYLGTEHHEFIVSYKDAINLIEPALDIFDEPFADSSAIPTLLVSKLAKQYVTVTLSGEGGDELFFGYGSYKWAKRLNNPLIQMSRHLIAGVFNQMPSRYQRIGKMLSYSNNDDKKSHIFSQEQYFFTSSELSNLLIEDQPFKLELLSWINEPNILAKTASFMDENSLSVKERKLNAMEQQAIFDLQYYLQDDLLTKVDRSSMQYSLETRVPYLDHRLIEQALNLSPHLKYQNNTSKFILKEILYQYIPKHIFQRPKQGFAIPLNIWLRNELKYLIDDNLSEEIVNRYDVVKYSEVKKIITQFMEGVDYLYNRIWVLIVLHNWLRKNA
ncbi:MAG TPA: asparagine synthase (glutamine-hydrolyzing) [Bacteroidia bacterium]|nr:asparagine synthase (glutamine-hydrolyzing) [Bacteroidia bacterium]